MARGRASLQVRGKDVLLEVARLREDSQAVLALEGLQAEVHGGDVRLEAVRRGKGCRAVLALERLQAEVHGGDVRLEAAKEAAAAAAAATGERANPPEKKTPWPDDLGVLSWSTQLSDSKRCTVVTLQAVARDRLLADLTRLLSTLKIYIVSCEMSSLTGVSSYTLEVLDDHTRAPLGLPSQAALEERLRASQLLPAAA